MALLDNAASPSVSVQRGITREAHIGRGWQRRKLVFNLPVESGETFEGVAGTLWIESKDVAIGSGDAKVLMLESGERSCHKKSSRKQNDGQGYLNDNQSLLGNGRAVAGTAIGRAQGFRRLGLRREPGWHCAEDDAGEQRNEECKSKHCQRRAGLDRHVASLRKGQQQNHARQSVRESQAGSSAN